MSVQTSGGQPIKSFRQTTTGAAVALASNLASNGWVMTALSTNTGTVYCGGSDVTTANGYPLSAGQSISYYVEDSAQIFIIGSDSAQVVAVTGN